MILGTTPDDVYALVSSRTDRTFKVLCVVAALVVFKLVGDIVVFLQGRRAARRTAKTDERINRILNNVEAHGQVTDNQKERIEQAVTTASGQAAQVARSASRKMEEAVQTIGAKQVQAARELADVKAELHGFKVEMSAQIKRLISKICPEADEDDSIFGKPNTGA